ncbi:ABC transporter ATP-binding protein [Kitasatospora sp. NPDC096077]|uniref:ABC transporter ATP-binding protein n=1 Tax=Kitasatospora sp. NPDC096077 TaxID=3155544 RepID=UPI00332BB405
MTQVSDERLERTAPAPPPELLPTATAAQTRAEVLARVLRRPWQSAAALLLVVAGVLAGLVVPRALGHLVDVVVAGGHQTSAVTGPVVLIGAACLAQALFAGWGAALVARRGEEVLAGLRESALGSALNTGLARLERSGSGDLVARVSGDVTVLGEAVRTLVPQLIGALLEIGLTLVALLLLDWRLALAALTAVPLQVYAVRWLRRRSGPVRRQERIAQGEQAQQILESVNGAHTVRAFGLGPRQLAEVERRSAAARDLALRSTHIGTRFFGKLNGAELTGLTGLLAVGFVLVRADAIAVGTASAAALYFLRLFDPINGLLSTVDEVQSASAAADRVVGLALLPRSGAPEPTAPRRPGSAAGPRKAAAVELHGVGHAYLPGHRVLHGVDLSLAPGERVAVVGTTGAGKSTLARLVAGVHPPSAGRILIDGRPVEELTDGRIRRMVALVNQETHVFAGTLAEDLRLARPEADDEELRAALGTVDAWDWAAALPQGLATEVGQGGTRLTPIQAQQLALARLVLADPPVAVLDEATAEAGSAGSRALEAAAERALAGRTSLVVAHRLTQAVRADRILVLEDGRLVEQGDHEQLVAAGGRYARLWAAWSGARD